MNTPPLSFSKEVSWGLGANRSYATCWAQRVSTEPSVTLTGEGEPPFNAHVTLKPTTKLKIDKHPTSKRPVVSEMMMTFLFQGPANKQTRHRKWVRVRPFCSSNRLRCTKLNSERDTDQMISTLKSYFLGFSRCHHTGVVKEPFQTLAVDKSFITNKQ